ncbi:MAG: DegV family protein [Lachnospiraceae bacterium]|nr:DegV family protein [Lachnospiraceae bacterium]MDO4409546.1 DegV family protein [Eubacteriales bacterium]
MKIITNTASSLTREEGKQLGIIVLPVSVSLGGRSLRDYIDIDSDRFAHLLHGDEMPVSSQPSIGDMMAELENTDEESIMLTVADGLSGEYSTAMGLRENLPNRDNIFVINSRSLAGPLRYMAVKAARLRDQGASAGEIVSQIRACAQSTISYVIPADFNYLRKSGRITNMTSRIGSALHLLPVLTQTSDHRRISFMTVRRTWKSAVGSIITSLKDTGIDDRYLISIAYADKKDLAAKVRRQILESFPRTQNEILQLSPSLITHGGPGCIVVQAVLK